MRNFVLTFHEVGVYPKPNMPANSQFPHRFVHLLLATMASLTYEQVRQRHAAASQSVTTPNYYDVMKMLDNRKDKRVHTNRIRQSSCHPPAASSAATTIIVQHSPLTKQDRIANVLLQHGVARDLLSAYCRAGDIMTDHADVDGFLAAHE